ncbi:rho guanine nucleotide exchange factor 39 isoform X2 [Betta splendens]|uniref:Rho guanine nucleotide exchange factor 39 isoform X2 n=1 Tax=Betta splendens TaxID=158456 RepID=A0A6P7NES6_BETSP|nr:rho guanine nucleotide exchange factor 39 isoform X2 [Betta splendens]
MCIRHPIVTMNCNPGPQSSIQQQREHWNRNHSTSARKLVQTEQLYNHQLQQIITYFVDILNAKGTLKQGIRESIFSSIKEIHSINQVLLVHLESGCIGRGFDLFCPNLQYYNTYVDNIYNASKVLRIQLKKNKAFRRFKKLQETRSEFNNHKLEELLQLPVQRIDQYKHFLQNLIANISPDNPEFQPLSRALNVVCTVSQRIENNTRCYENHLQLCRVQKLLKGQQMKVLAAGRWYIREGWLKVVPPKGAQTKPMMFFLFSDMLLQAKRCSPLYPTNGNKFVGQHAYPLQDCTVEKVFGHTKSQGGLLSLSFPKAKLLLMSSNQVDLNEWYKSLTSAIRKLHSTQTVVHQRDEFCPRTLREAPENNSTSNSTTTTAIPQRNRNLGSSENDVKVHKSSVECKSSAPKRMKQSQTPEQRVDTFSFGCVIL